ncbi:Olfactory receptor-like protein OLF4 [Myotis brandtii]|uniref:Olfactory receptor-like protein OLF4 n=1 Tax=Myotis brandtii TaxID=109478 RepID=S7MPZ7_MYOBR|nr:Olfactory receptor-like protein OLF4 [Myotis brandtii]
MLWNNQTQSKVITYEACITQMYFVILFAEMHVFFLTWKAYDCFMTICYHLHCMVTMNPRLCGLLALICWIMNVLHSFLQCLMALRWSFCMDMEIPHFFCELSQMIKLACSDTILTIMEQEEVEKPSGAIGASSRCLHSLMALSDQDQCQALAVGVSGAVMSSGCERQLPAMIVPQ